MKNDKVKKWLCLILIFGGFFILRNFIPSGLDQAGWDGFLVLFVAVLLWLTEAVPMAVTNVGPLKGDELKFTIVFAIMVVLWFIPKQTGIDMYMTAWGGIFIMSLPGMNLVNWKEASTKIDWSAFLICGAATALATVVANLGTGAWLSGILSNLFLSKVAGMGLVVLLLVINVMMAVGHYPMPQGVSLAGLCLPVVGALAVNLGLNPIVVCLPVCMSTSMLLLVPIDPTCFTTYSGGYWKIKDMMSSGILITIGYILVSSLWTAVIAATGALG